MNNQSREAEHDTMENYILKHLSRLEAELKALAEQIQQQGEGKNFYYSQRDYEIIFHSLTSKKEMLYIILTGHNNSLANPIEANEAKK